MQMPRPKGPYVFELLGKPYREDSKIAALRSILVQLARRDGRFLEELSDVDFDNKHIVAKDPTVLNPDRSDPTHQHSEPIAGNWWFYKDIGDEHIIPCLERACQVAELEYRKDLKLTGDNWQRKLLSPNAFFKEASLAIGKRPGDI